MASDLVDRDGYLLVDRDGRAADGDTCDHVCCGAPPACSFYAQLAPCAPPPPLPPPGLCAARPPFVYACGDSLCSDGTTPAFPFTPPPPTGPPVPPLPGEGAGRLYIIDSGGACYQFSGFVRADQVPPVGPDVRVLAAGTPITCLGPPVEGAPTDCRDERCRYPGTYIEAGVCPGVDATGVQRLFICAAHVRGCNVVDLGERNAAGDRVCRMIGPGRLFRTDEIPPGARVDDTSIFDNGGGTCCACVDGCNPVDLREDECLRIERPPPPRPQPARQCCCDNEDRYQVTRWSFHYDFVRLGGVSDGTLINSDIATPLAPGSFRGLITTTVPPSSGTLTQAVPVDCGFNSVTPPSYFPSPGFDFCTPMCVSCSPDADTRIVITSFVWVHRCDYVSFLIEFEQYVDPHDGGGMRLNVRGVMSMAVRRIAAPAARCSGGCSDGAAPEEGPAPGEGPAGPPVGSIAAFVGGRI